MNIMYMFFAAVLVLGIASQSGGILFTGGILMFGLFVVYLLKNHD